MEQIQATGRRKSAISRVYLKRGNGNIFVNGKAYQEYFRVNHIQGKIIEPLKEVGVENLYDIKVNVKGGGTKGQAEAVRLGIARALVQLNEDFRSALKTKKLLTRDPRQVERKKYGRPKARRGFQFSKR